MPALDPSLAQAIDQVMRSLDREVWIVTAAAGEDRGGLVATWVMQVSLAAERPAVLVGVAPNHYTRELIDAGGAFGLHLLEPQQAEVGLAFAMGSGRDRDKFQGLAVRRGITGSPLLEDCLAWLECRVFARLDAGDRVFFWADVVDGRRRTEANPLREHQLITAASPAQLTALREDRELDIQRQEAPARAWRENLPGLLHPLLPGGPPPVKGA